MASNRYVAETKSRYVLYVAQSKMYSFVTVAHDVDSRLLHIQARSMSLFASPLIVGEIIIIENFDPNRRVNWRDTLLSEYGKLAALVRFIDRDTLCQMPSVDGWWTQQVLKLVVAHIVKCPRYIVLDAKNHLVSPIKQDFIEAPDGRIRTSLSPYDVNHCLRSALERVTAYCDLTLGNDVVQFTPTITPFTMITEDVIELIQFVESKEGKPFPQAFIDLQLTEFFLYSARLIQRGKMEETHTFDQLHCPIVWDHLTKPADLLQLIREADEGMAPVFGVHRRSFPILDSVAREILGQFWARRGLFPSTADAVANITDGVATPYAAPPSAHLH